MTLLYSPIEHSYKVFKCVVIQTMLPNFSPMKVQKTLFTAREEHEFVGVHAGLTEEEMTVPFIAVETEKRKKR